jgi:hypothetical protein
MVLLFGRLYELRAEKAAEGGAKVVVVGPPCAGKTTFIKQFLEPRGVEAAEEVVGLAPVAEETRGEGLRERAVRLLRGLAGGGYVSRDRVEKELAGVRGAELLKAFDELPRDFVEYLKKKYGGWSLYLFYIPPEVEEEREAVEDLLKIAKRVGVEFRWFGLRYVPPGVVAMLKEGGVGYVEEQLGLYRRVLGEFGAAGGRLAMLARLGRSVAEKTGESLLERFAEAAEEFAKDLLSLLLPSAAAGAVLGIASYFLSGHRVWRDWIRLLADWSRLDGRLKDLAAAYVALELGVGKEEVRDALDSLSNKELEKLEGKVKELYDEVEELWDEVIAQRLAKYGDVYTRRRAEGLRVTYHKVVDAGVEYRLVTAGGFTEAAEEVERLLAERGFVVVRGSRGIGKSTLAAYVAYDMLKKGDVDYVVKVKSPVDVSEVDVFKALGRRALLFFDIYPREVYLEKFDPRRPLEELYGSVEDLLSLAALAERSRKAGAGLYVLAAVHDEALAEAYKGKAVRDWLGGASLYVPQLNTPEFLAGVLKSYACPNEDDCCLDKVDIERLVSLISSHDAYTLVAKYTGLWLKESKCDAEKLEEALKSSLKPSKAEPKLYLAHYIWHVLLRGKGDLARKAAVPLLLHARFGPVPVGVTYITKAVKNGVWRFLKPEELEGVSLESLREDELEPIARWLAQRHEDLVEETLRDLAGLNGEEARQPYRETLRNLIKALDWARDEALNEGGEILAELGVPEEGRGSENSLLTFAVRRLVTVLKSGGGGNCWQRVAFIAGHALAVYPKLPKRERLSKDVVETLGDALKPCAVDEYLTIDGVIPPLSIGVFWFLYYVETLYARDLSQIRKIRERLDVLTPYANADIIKAVKKTAEELLARWRRRDLNLHEACYALGLAVLAARGETDEETADLLLNATSFAAQRMALPVAGLPVLEMLRSLGEKAPHRYVSLLAAASELETLDRKTVLYIYDVLKQFKDRLLKAGRLWSLVEAVRAYSNLLRKHLGYIRDHWEETVVDMCELYSKVRERSAVARAYVLAVALGNDVLAPLVQRYCGIGDLEKEAKDVMNELDEAAASPEELKKIMENDKDFAKWVTAHNIISDAGLVIEDLRAWLMYELILYKLVHALDEGGELDEKKLEEAAEEFEKAAEINRRLKLWRNYLAGYDFALRARVLVAKSWEELLKRAEGFQELWEKAKKHLKPTTEYLITAVSILGGYLVYLAASGYKKMAEELLKELGLLLSYRPKVSVAARLMLKLLGVGEGARLKEVVDVFGPGLFPELIWLMLIDCLRRDKALEERGQLSKAKDHVDSVAPATGVQEFIELLKSCIEKIVPETRPLLDKVDGETLVEVLASGDSRTRLAFMLLAAVEGRVDAVRLHGLWGSAAYKGTVLQPLFRNVYENCGDLNSEECKLALLKLYYLH